MPRSISRFVLSTKQQPTALDPVPSRTGRGLAGLRLQWETGVCMPATGRAIVFLSDFGYRNEWVGICHAVMNRIAPASPIVDLSHGVPPLDVRGGAVLLVDSLPYLSAEAILLAIVDPSVGRDRDVAFESNDGRLVVGPDNGLALACRSCARRSRSRSRDHLTRHRVDADLAVVPCP